MRMLSSHRWIDSEMEMVMEMEMHVRNLRRLGAGFSLSLALASVPAAVQGQPYPAKPIQMIVNSAPGAGTDLTARTVSERLGERLGTTLVVDNRGGAAGIIGAQAAKRAAADGYTLLFTNDNMVLMIALGANKDVNILADFAPIVLATTIDFYLVVSGSALAAKTAGDLARIARAKPGSLSYASPGIGAPHHLAMELFKQQTGTDIVHVPYKGMGPAIPDLLAGRVQVTITGFPAVSSHMSSGKLRILGVASPVRSEQQPAIPTLAQSGVPNVEIQGYNYLVAPLATPAAIVARLNAEFNAVLKMPQVRADLVKRGTSAAGGSAEDLRRKLRAETDKWTQVVKIAGIKPE
ncbi:MAG: tripartite tricarboxylate transporter substrate binding protein [Burkholderiales bacterium]|nr:tripartite tricarboxylate transporter substrate binding protein [Burkholderiales bacterium]